jgi:hypothetical protein
MKPLDHRGQRARAATDVENALAWPKCRLIEQRPPGRITARQLQQMDRRAALASQAQLQEGRFVKIPRFRLPAVESVDVWL